jgi:hypothetical protein
VTEEQGMNYSQAPGSQMCRCAGMSAAAHGPFTGAHGPCAAGSQACAAIVAWLFLSPPRLHAGTSSKAAEGWDTLS